MREVEGMDTLMDDNKTRATDASGHDMNTSVVDASELGMNMDDTNADERDTNTTKHDTDKDEPRQFAVGILVNNHFGVLNRIAGLYAKRCYNIDSLAVGETENPLFSRMTIVSTGDAYMRKQVVKQLRKLHDVKGVVLFDNGAAISVENVLVKLDSGSTVGADISESINRFGGRIKDFGEGYVLVEVTGEPKKIEAFFEMVRPMGIIETCRSGVITMSHGFERTLEIEDVI